MEAGGLPQLLRLSRSEVDNVRRDASQALKHIGHSRGRDRNRHNGRDRDRELDMEREEGREGEKDVEQGVLRGNDDKLGREEVPGIGGVASGGFGDDDSEEESDDG